MPLVTGATATLVEDLDEKGVGHIVSTTSGVEGAHADAHARLNAQTNARYPDGDPGKIEYDMGSGSVGEDSWYRTRGTSTSKYQEGTDSGSSDVVAATGTAGMVIVQKECFIEGGIMTEVRDSATGKFKGSSQNRRYQKHFYPGTVFRNLSTSTATTMYPQSGNGTAASDSGISVYSTDTGTVTIPTVKAIATVLGTANVDYFTAIS